MKKELKAVCGIVLAIAAVMSAGRASSEISIGMEPVAYSVRPAAWGQVSRPASSDRLSAAAESLAEAAGSGDNAKVETLLAGLYSGAARKEAAAPVYVAARPAAALPAVSAPVKKAAAVKRAKRAAASKAASTLTTEAEWILVAQEADATEEAPAAKEKDGKDEAAKPEAEESVSNTEQAAADYSADFGVEATEEAPEKTLLQDLLGGGIGMMIVILLILLL